MTRHVELGAVVVGLLAIASLVAIVAFASPVADDEPTELIHPDPPELPEQPDGLGDGQAMIGEETYTSITAADAAANPGDTIAVSGQFSESVTVTTPNVSIVADGDALIDGGDSGHVIEIAAEDVTIESVWITGSGHDLGNEDAGIFVDGARATISDVVIDDTAFGVWIDGVPDVTVESSVIDGREDLYPRTNRGNGIHLWQATNATLEDNAITNARDGIYYQWSSGVHTTNNTLWDLRYGVHYMYSDDNRLEGNLAMDSHAGFALMVSSNLTVVDNLAIANRGASEHGILLKDIDDSQIVRNHVVDNGNGLYVYNAERNEFRGNLIFENDIGIVRTAGSYDQVYVDNAFVENTVPAVSTTMSHQPWNASDRGNYWSSAGVVDLDGDGISDVRYRPAGVIEELRMREPGVDLFESSPAFDAIRLAEDSFPVLAEETLVDHHPLTEPPTEDWTTYYGD